MRNRKSLAFRQKTLCSGKKTLRSADTRVPISRQELAVLAKVGINSSYKSNKQLDFLGFVLSHYAEEGIDELDLDKLPPLLRLKYNAIADAAAELGTPQQIREVFVGFQKYLYLEKSR